MVAFLWITSFIFHIVSFFLIILLFLKWTKVKEIEKRQAEMIREMETLMASYLVEFKEENDRFVRQLTSKQNHSKQNKKVKREEPFLPLPNIEVIEDRLEISMKDEQQDEQSVQELAEQAFLLQQQGKTLDEIAKILKKGKTEIELLLKFRQK
jgi:biopolymer transport protein ExbB/TolQ